MERVITSKWVLPIIVVSQFFCTSLWFAGNAIMPDILQRFQLDPGFLAHLTSVIQFGFITGTLVFALLAIADRFSPSRVFFVCSLLAGLFNLGIALPGVQPTGILFFRFLTGFFLAGIYPVGMKIASDYFQKGLGKSLGFLVGALVLGTAFPHLLKSITTHFPWVYVVYLTSILSVLGGLAIWLFVPDGPFRKAGQQLIFREFLSGFKSRNFRAAAFGYFGHMWELYAFWAFVPVMLASYANRYPAAGLNISFLSFLIIASGSLACVGSGYLSGYFGAKKVATSSLVLSCLCCLVSPFFLSRPSPSAFIIFLFFWGVVVIADSPLFSTLVAQNAPERSRGTSLTLVNCIGFSITIISIQLINLLSGSIDGQYVYMTLALGPVVGLLALLKKRTSSGV
ncbi:MFS transporter [Spirosoma spitsbergense]|uniref:MFS transporter n=1 Tax=Spirosoma spitsbergense TaxID=431554 RepID=UPI0003A53166|nr:MFS transporter [Spirosoma spitsbergense]